LREVKNWKVLERYTLGRCFLGGGQEGARRRVRERGQDSLRSDNTETSAVTRRKEEDRLLNKEVWRLPTFWFVGVHGDLVSP